MAYIELRGKNGLEQFTVDQLQHFTFNCENAKREMFHLRLGLVKQGMTYYFCISKSDMDVKTVPNGCKAFRDTTTWKVYNERMIRDITPDDIDGLGSTDRKLYRQLLQQFIDTNEKKFANTY